MNNLLFAFLSVNNIEADSTVGTFTSLFSSIFIVAIFGVIIYFVSYRPAKKQASEMSTMQNNLKVGDEISTHDGILGKILSIGDDTILIESQKAKIIVKKQAIRSVESVPEEE